MAWGEEYVHLKTRQRAAIEYGTRSHLLRVMRLMIQNMHPALSSHVSADSCLFNAHLTMALGCHFKTSRRCDNKCDHNQN